MFENQQVSLEALPSVADVQWQPLADRYLWDIVLGQAVLLGTLLMLGFAASALDIADIPRAFLTPTLAYISLHLGGSLLWARLALRRKRYAIRDRDILYRTGVIWHSLTAIPFNRIQHVETTSGVLERLFGLASIVVYTAGGSGGDLKIPGLPQDRAERLREFILRRADEAEESA